MDKKKLKKKKKAKLAEEKGAVAIIIYSLSGQTSCLEKSGLAKYNLTVYMVDPLDAQTISSTMRMNAQNGKLTRITLMVDPNEFYNMTRGGGIIFFQVNFFYFYFYFYF